MSRSRVDLIVWDNGRAAARMILHDGCYLVGRDPACAIHLPSERVSREHARVVVHGSTLVIEDLDSRNGLYFDGQRTRVHPIDDGNYIFVDPFVLEFQVKRVEPVIWSPRPRVVMNQAAVEPTPKVAPVGALHMARIVPLTEGIRSERAGRPEIELDLDVISIGRGTDRKIQLDDHAASRHHAEIRRLGHVWVLRDLQSANGTYVNGRRVRETSLKNGDEVRIGVTVLRFDLYQQVVRERRAS